MPDVPVSLTWENIGVLWDRINNTRASKDPAAWETLVDDVRLALEDWREVVNYWPKLIKKYNLIKHLRDRSEGEKRQAHDDAIQSIRDKMSPQILKAVDGNKKIVPIKLRVIEDLLHMLEGVRQGDFNAYSGPVKTKLAQWEQEAKEEQHKFEMLKRNLLDRLNGVQDEVRRGTMTRRIEQLYSNIKDTNWQIKNTDNPNENERLEKRISGYNKEIKSISRRLEGVKKPESRTRIQVMLNEIDNGLSETTAEMFNTQACQACEGAGKTEDVVCRLCDGSGRIGHGGYKFFPGAKLRSEEEIKQEMLKKAADAKYDALLWIVTNISHPIKVLKTKKSFADRPVKMPYMPPEQKEEETIDQDTEVEIDLERPPKQVSECSVLSSIIRENKFDIAKQFWTLQYGLSTGDLITLEHTDMDGLKGRIRSIIDDVVTVDLFKNQAANNTVKVALYQARPYL
jgi:hypothetical protein